MAEEIKSEKQMAYWAADLLDSEAVDVFRIVMNMKERYEHRAFTVENLDEFRDETLTKLAERGFLATIDVAPMYYHEPPVVEILGRISGEPEAVDHEQKQFQVLRANDRGEEYYGQKESTKSRKRKK